MLATWPYELHPAVLGEMAPGLQRTDQKCQTRAAALAGPSIQAFSSCFFKL